MKGKNTSENVKTLVRISNKKHIRFFYIFGSIQHGSKFAFWMGSVQFRLSMLD